MSGSGRAAHVLFVLCTVLLVRNDAVFGNSTKPDSSVTVKTTDDKSPMGAVCRSALIPGWGQLYAREPIHAAAAFCGVAGLAGWAMYENQRVVQSRTREEREFYQYYRSQAVWWCCGVYLLNLMDAFVNAHLLHFDTDPDLTLRSEFGSSGICRLGLSWSFH